MTAYILTPAQYSQLVDALWTVIEHNKLHHGVENNTVSQCESALAMLKAMKPVEPTAFLIEFENGETELHFHDANNSLGESQTALYAMETKQ